MGKFLLRRLANYLVLVVLATTFGYLLAANSLHPRSNYEGRNPPPPKASIDRTLDRLNMNDETPVLTRFRTWASGVVRGDFGKTIHGQPISAELGRRVGVSLRLLLIGSVLGAVIGIAIGVLGAIRQYRPSDHATTALSFVILATPVFLLAVLLKFAAIKTNQSIGQTIFLTTGEFTPALQTGWWDRALDRLQHLVLPTLSLTLGQAAFFSRYQRNAMLDVLGSDFLRTAQAKGLRRRTALIKHGLRTALIPMATFFAFEIGLLLTGATYTEKIFSWNGMGSWLIDSITQNDVNVVATVLVFIAILVLIAGFLSDLILALLDPRVRVG